MINRKTIDRLNRFPRENSRLLDKLAGPLPLIVVHRGSSDASIAENTTKAFHVANLLGADIVETDIIRSTDGDYFLFHDGMEEQHFGLEVDIKRLSTAELNQLSYQWHADPAKLQYGLEPLESLNRFPATIFNVDRSWSYWPEFLGTLADLDITSQLLLKSHVGPNELKALSDAPVKFPYMPIVSTMAEVNAVMACREINTVAFELLATTPDDEFSTPEAVEAVREMGYLIQLNALNLPNRNDLYLGWDDEASIFQFPAAGWGKLIDQGADLVQTDWPSLLRDYRTTLTSSSAKEKKEK